MRLISYLVGEANALYPKPLTEPLVLNHAERTLLILLLEQQPHNYSEEMKSKSMLPFEWQVLRAEEYVKLNLGRSLTVVDVACGAGVTTRTLSRAFKRHRKCTPVQFIRQSKLNAVHKNLQSAGRCDSVTEIAAHWGFLHSGHFAANYFEQFGETPSQTLNNHERN